MVIIGNVCDKGKKADEENPESSNVSPKSGHEGEECNCIKCVLIAKESVRNWWSSHTHTSNHSQTTQYIEEIHAHKTHKGRESGEGRGGELFNTCIALTSFSLWNS